MDSGQDIELKIADKKFYLDALSDNELPQSRPQSEFVALPLLWDTRGRSAM